jgi:hypothetical protein
MKEKCVMKYLKYVYAVLFAYFLLSAAPAFAQFEVSPDHFDEPPRAKTKVPAASKKKIGTQANPSSQAAGHKLNTARKVSATRNGPNQVKSRSVRKVGNNIALATKSNSVAPNLKAR